MQERNQSLNLHPDPGGRKSRVLLPNCGQAVIDSSVKMEAGLMVGLHSFSSGAWRFGHFGNSISPAHLS